MIPYYKYVSGDQYEASPLYDGYYNDRQFKMVYKDKFWFDLEVRGFEILKEKSYAPKLLSVDIDNNTLVFDWTNSKNINHIINFNEDLPINWQEQIKNIIIDLEMSSLYKINLYPWTFYVKDSNIHVMDLYACLPVDDVVYKKDIYHILNDTDRFKFNNNILDIQATYQHTLKHIVEPWLGKIIND